MMHDGEAIELRSMTDRDLLVRIATTVDGHGRAMVDHENRIRSNEILLIQIKQDRETEEKTRGRILSLGMGLATLAGGMGHLVAQWLVGAVKASKP